METRAERDRRLEAWRRLAAGGSEVERLLVEVDAGTRAGGATPALVAGLRKRFDAELVAAALDAVAGRRKAAVKFPGAVPPWGDPQAVEQATSGAVAACKARRFAGLDIADLCCGMGGDAMALARVDPLEAWQGWVVLVVFVAIEDMRWLGASLGLSLWSRVPFNGCLRACMSMADAGAAQLALGGTAMLTGVIPAWMGLAVLLSGAAMELLEPLRRGTAMRLDQSLQRS